MIPTKSGDRPALKGEATTPTEIDWGAFLDARNPSPESLEIWTRMLEVGADKVRELIDSHPVEFVVAQTYRAMERVRFEADSGYAGRAE